MNEKICKNCSNAFNENFCNRCGQKSSVRRVDYDYVISEVAEGVFQLEKGWLYTIKELFIRPGKSIKKYLQGERIQFAKPIPFILLTSALYVFIAYLFNIPTFTEDFVSGIKNYGDDSSRGIDKSTETILHWFTSNHAYAVLITLPFFSLGTYLAFKKCRYNYFEHLIINTFIAGQQMVIYILFSPLILINKYLDGMVFIVGTLFCVMAFYQLFEIKNAINKTLRIILVYVLFIIIITILLLANFFIIKII